MSRNFKSLLGAAALFAGAGVANAGVAPAPTINASLGGVGVPIVPAGALGENGYLYERDFNTDALTTDVADGTIDIGWSWLADPSLSRGFGGPVSLNGGLTVQNNTSSTQLISIQTTLPLFSMIAPSSVIGGSVAATLNASIDGGSLSTNGTAAFYRGMIDGAIVPLDAADLVPAPMSSIVGPFQSGGFLATSFGDPIPSQPAGEITSSIGIWITFNLSAGDSMSFTSGFVADIPTPGSAAIILIAGLIANQRRRR
jgi:hypothetical protein